MEDLEIGQEKPAEKRYPYFAFISYKRSDSRFAAWIHRKLNWYRFPNKLVEPVNHPPHPKYIRPVLRDKNNLEVNQDSFWESIKKQLSQARFLIVLCSPESAKSPYVNNEIKHFLEDKNRNNAFDYVLPVIIKGNPGKGDETECLPSALQRPEILERNLPTMIPDEGEKEIIAWERCLTRMVAFLLRVSHERIRDEYRLAQQRQARIKLALAGAAVIILTIIAGWALVERDLKDAARIKAQTSLARADFQEASRLLDKGDTGLGLAHLGSALKNIPFSPAIERANGLILNRSWMIKTGAYELKTDSDLKMFSPGFKYILSAGKEEDAPPVLEIREAFSDLPPQKLALPSKNIRKIFFTDDGMGLVVVSDNDKGQQYNLWYLKGLVKMAEFAMPSKTRFVDAFRSGKLLVVTAGFDAFKIIDAVSEQSLFTSTKKSGNQWLGLDVDDDENIIAFAQGSIKENQISYLQSISLENIPTYNIKCVKIEEKKELVNLDGTGKIEHLKIVPGGNFLIYVREAMQEQTRLEIVPLVPGVESRSIGIETGRIVRDLAISPDGLHVALETWKQTDPYGTECRVRIYDLFDGNETGPPLDLPDMLTNWAYSHDGQRLALLTKSSVLHLLTVKNGKSAAESLQLPCKIHGIGFSQNDRHIRLHTPGELAELTIQVSPIAPRRIVPSPFIDTPVIKSVVTHPQRGFLVFLLKAGSPDKTKGAIDIHPLEKSKIRTDDFIERINGEPNCGAFSPDGQLLAIGLRINTEDEDKGMALIYQLPKSTSSYDIKNWKKIKTISLPWAVTKVEFSHDGKWLFLLGDYSTETSRKLALYNCTKNELEPPFIRHEGTVDDACFSWDSTRVISAGSDKCLRIWNITDRKEEQVIKCNEFPEFVVSSPNGNFAYSGRFTNINGEVAVFTENGKSLWRKNFEFGIKHLSINHSGELLAVGTLGNKACVFDMATGRQLTEWMTQRWPISSMAFIRSGLRDALVVGEHDPSIPFTGMGDNGLIETWDLSTFRSIGDAIEHSDGIKTIIQISDGHICSYSLEAAVVFPNPLFSNIQASDRKTMIHILSELSGTVLGQGGVSMLYQPSNVDKKNLSDIGQAILKWFHTPLETRSIEPGSRTMILDRLKDLSRGGLEEYETVLDIAPDYSPVLTDYWFTAASESAEIDYMKKVKNESAFEKNRLLTKWNLMSPFEKRQAIFNNRKASRIADFWTLQACSKAPGNAKSWHERSIFLRHKGRSEESAAALSKAAKLAPDDLSIQFDIIHHLFGKNGPALALKKMNTLCDKIKEKKLGELTTICNLGFFRLFLSAFVDGSSEHLDESLTWMKQTIKNRIKNISSGNETFYHIMDVSSRVSGFLMHFPQSTIIARDFTLNMAELLEETYPLEAKDSWYHAALFTNASLLSLVVKEPGKAIDYSNQAVSRFPDDPIFLMNQAHCLDLAGQGDKASQIYQTILDLDKHYSGKLSLEMYKDLSLMTKYGTCPPSLLNLQGQLTSRLEKAFEKGYAIKSIKPGSQAEKIGLVVGDELFRYNSKPILDDEAFGWERIASLWSEKADPDTITIIRDKKQFQFNIRPGLLGITLEKIR